MQRGPLSVDLSNADAERLSHIMPAAVSMVPSHLNASSPGLTASDRPARAPQPFFQLAVKPGAAKQAQDGRNSNSPPSPSRRHNKSVVSPLTRKIRTSLPTHGLFDVRDRKSSFASLRSCHIRRLYHSGAVPS